MHSLHAFPETSNRLPAMRALLQRVNAASVTVDGHEVGSIGSGLLVLLGVGVMDGPEDLEWLARKTLQLRIFADAEGAMNRSITDVAGGILVISQFTLFARTKKGNRPSFVDAAPPEKAEALYETFCRLLAARHCGPVAAGKFGAHMEVSLINDGPVTIWIDTRERE
jgi:D-tyrosyl-tRNA(Tyr) deacylase